MTRRIIVGVVLVVVAAGAFVALTERAAKPTIPVVGDSITFLTGYDISVALRGAYHADVQAKPGKRIDQMLPSLQSAVARRPRAAVVNLGTNDALQVQTHPNWHRGFDRMIALLAPVRCVELTTINTRLPARWSRPRSTRPSPRRSPGIRTSTSSTGTRFSTRPMAPACCVPTTFTPRPAVS
jgi:hypothetical protein